MRSIIKRIGVMPAQPAKYLKRGRQGPEGQRKGILTTFSEAIDGIARGAWDRIYKGTAANAHNIASIFMAKYSKHIY